MGGTYAVWLNEPAEVRGVGFPKSAFERMARAIGRERRGLQKVEVTSHAFLAAGVVQVELVVCRVECRNSLKLIVVRGSVVADENTKVPHSGVVEVGPAGGSKELDRKYGMPKCGVADT